VAIDLSGEHGFEDPGFKIKGQQAEPAAIAKDVLKAFYRARPNDRIGLVAFAGGPTLGPLTLITISESKTSDRLALGLIEDGTAIDRFYYRDQPAARPEVEEQKIVILMTTDRTRWQSAAADRGGGRSSVEDKVYTIGVGTHGDGPFRTLIHLAEGFYVQAPVDIDEDTPEGHAARRAENIIGLTAPIRCGGFTTRSISWRKRRST